MTSLADLAWPDVPEHGLVVMPLGSTEQHGPHLPLSTDTLIAAELAGRLCAARSAQCVLGPTIPVGASGEHQGFAGTLSIGTEALRHLLVELVRSAVHSFAGVVLVNGHGGNHQAVGSAVELLCEQGHRVLSWSPALPRGGDHHAGRTETSVLMAIAAHLVATERMVPGNTTPLVQLLPELRRGGVSSVSPSGVLGDPVGSTATEGHALMAEWTQDLLASFDRWAG